MESRSHHSSVRSFSNLVSVYVDNLPYEMDLVWLNQLFRGYGEVVDVFIPKKRSSKFNTKFGFVRFNSKDEALRAVQDLHGTRIRDLDIQVNLARYSQNRGNKNLLHSSNDFITSGRNPISAVYKVKSNSKSEFIEASGPSYADIVAGKNSPVSRSSIKVHAEDSQWLSRSAIAKLPAQRSVDSLREAFISEGVWNIQLRPMGGIYVLLTFDSIEDMNSMLEGGGLCWLMNCKANLLSHSDSEVKSGGEKGVNVEVEEGSVENNNFSSIGNEFIASPLTPEVALNDEGVDVNGENYFNPNEPNVEAVGIWDFGIFCFVSE
ncbi:hypothetical protein Vadar_017130 [Vaccinium darrowii]|uniref:Uncharacterized protein n=1 Tax=Vaccinium darrowii TaxID=229202 RepID=A0ACB7YM92_9ERIC|nr:hypothetical protein Vadar_017130 [Vaccinium darrowii]